MAVHNSSGGAIRIIPFADNLETSIGYYGYTDMRTLIANDMWVSGMNSWGRSGYVVGASGFGWCLNIISTGSIVIASALSSPTIVVNTLRAQTENQLTLKDNVIMNGSLVVNGSFNCSASSSVIYTTP